MAQNNKKQFTPGQVVKITATVKRLDFQNEERHEITDEADAVRINAMKGTNFTVDLLEDVEAPAADEVSANASENSTEGTHPDMDDVRSLPNGQKYEI